MPTMAYSALINLHCSADGCTARATREVFGRRNASQGLFCRPHALRAVRDLEKAEARADRVERKTGAIPVLDDAVKPHHEE